MENVEMMVDNLEAAHDCINSVRDELEKALKNANAVQAIVIFDLMEKSVHLEEGIDRLLNAVRSED